MSYENLKVETTDGVAVITIDRPSKLNALDARTVDELDRAFAAVACDPGVKGAVLTGSGEKAFAAGADIAELSALRPDEARSFSRRGQAVFDRIERLEKPVVAAVNGFALGGGCELALACHLRFAAEGARLGTPEVKLGLMCGYGGTQRLPRLVGRGPALVLLLSGEQVDAAEALRIGLVNRVVPKEALLAEAEAFVRKAAANGALALRYTLQAVAAGLDLPLDHAQNLEATLFGLLGTSEDMREGTRAFLEKRPPQFKGR
jgi:enoyl-CoA hydratase